MTSAVVCYPFVGDSVGGSHVSMIPVLQGIRDRGFTPLVVVHQAGPLTRYFDERGIGYVLLPSVRPVAGGSIMAQVVKAMIAAPRLVSFLKQHRIRIVHTNDARMHFTWGPAARIAGRKFVWHQRSMEPSRRLGYYSRLAHTVLTISDHCRRSFVKPMSSRALVVRDPFDTRRPGIDRASARQSLGVELGLANDEALIGYVGNLTPQKRPLFFVDIAVAVRDRLGGKARFAMFGEQRPDLAAKVEAKIVDLGLTGACRLMGPRYPIEPMIAACDVLVAPAKAEGLGRTLIEAMLAGTPVVAADDAGHREAIVDGETGCLIAPDDAGRFAEAVIDLVRDHARRDAMTRKAAAFAKVEFSTERHLDVIASVYRGLVGVA